MTLLDVTDRSDPEPDAGRSAAGRPSLMPQWLRSWGSARTKLLARLTRMKEDRVITRFGPFFDAAAMGGAFCLCAMAVPETEFETVLTKVNAHAEVAHNYERTHRLNMWFVLATETPDGIGALRRCDRTGNGDHGPAVSPNCRNSLSGSGWRHDRRQQTDRSSRRCRAGLAPGPGALMPRSRRGYWRWTRAT